MIIPRMIGGIGNQLFIYAAARRLALKNSVGLKLDITSGYKNDFYARKFSLSNFNIKAEIASEFESYGSCFGRVRKGISRTIAKTQPFEKRNYIVEEDSHHFDERLLNLKIDRKVYMEGYWQSEKYFKDVESVIRDDLKIIAECSAKSKEFAQVISRCNAVSLHARRLHGVGNIKAGTPKDSVVSLGIEYYKKAIKSIAEKVDNPHFFCFSDFPGWLEGNLNIDYPMTFITHNWGDEQDHEAKSYEDLWLMSQCKHHILANSSFSWWGAWLSRNQEKIVICPDPEKWNLNKDFVSEGWECVKI